MKLFQMFALGTLVAAGLAVAQVPSAPSAGQAAKTTAKEVKKAVKPAPTAAEIADAKTKNLVWVNHNTKVYHKSDAKTYGTTKNGEFMTEDEAVKAGNRAAKEPVAKTPKATDAKK